MFRWVPAIEVDSAALKRLREHAPKPKKSMGEAWFMGEKRKQYDVLLGKLDHVATEQIQDILEQIASGTSSFGAFDEWTDWYHHLLPRLLHRSNEHYIEYTLEHLYTCFFAIYPDETNVHGPYKKFKQDALATLGQVMMDDARWNGAELRLDRALHRGSFARNGYPLWRNVSGDLSSSLFFCTKYLETEDFDTWLASILQIESPHWRAQLLVWFSEAHSFLTGELQQVSELNVDSAIKWAGSHVLDGHYTGDYESVTTTPYLAESGRTVKCALVARHFQQVDVDSWLHSISKIDYLLPGVDEVFDKFVELYL